MAENDRRDGGDMVLAPNEYMYVSDQTKGHVDVFVGPTKQSLSNTDQPVIFDTRTKKFTNVDRDHAKQLAHTAPEGWYIILKNPAKDGKQPAGGQGKLGSATLNVGKKVIVPGPVTFCLWPGQMAKILKGHHLRSNQYLLVRVYDEEEARKNWSQAVIKTVTQTDAEVGTSTPFPSLAETTAVAAAAIDPPKLTMGQVLVIKGTDVSFYIPPTGIEVIPDTDILDADGRPTLVREAVTLERLEYCLLMDEQGSKRYERGPAVVFPKPTEVFITRDQEGDQVRKFEAIKLNVNSGIYIQVIAPYTDETGAHKVGEELFITGKEKMIYFPREEHAIVKYDKSEIHYAIAIPAGEARYVLDRNKGTVSKVEGPLMFLPDPREQVIVRRILPFRTCSLLYPNNMAAFAHNAKLAGVDIDTYMSHQGAEVVSAAAAAAPAAAMNFMAMDYEATSSHLMRSALGSSADSRGLAGRAGTKAAGDAIQRKNKYTEPRSIVLSTKYDGAVAINVYTGYAVLLVKSNGSRRVVQGPQTVLLDYDETPEILELSTGKPKTTDNMLRTAYLRTTANKIGDIIEVDTADHCKFQVKLSYRMDFTGDDPELWFAVENYVKFLCDNMRSRLKNAVRRVGVEEFYANSTDIIRETVLKETAEGFGPRIFSDNGMRVYDVEVLMVKLVDQDIETLISKSQRAIIQTTIAIANQRRTLEAGKEEESIKQQMARVRFETNQQILALEAEEAVLRKETELAKVRATAEALEVKLTKELEAQTARNLVSEESRKSDKAQADFDAAQEQRRQDLKIAMIQAEIRAVVDKAQAITPDLIAALQQFGDNDLVIKAAEAMAPLAILGGKNIGEVLGNLLSGTKLGTAAVAALTAAGGNGSRDARA